MFYFVATRRRYFYFKDFLFLRSMRRLVFKRKGNATNVVVKSHDVHPSTLSNIHIKNAGIKIIVYEFLNSETDINSNVERTAIIF